jgi:nicotinamidase-related amidase
MSVSIPIDPPHTAILSMDLQAGIISIYAKDEIGFPERAARVLAHSRQHELRVIHIQVGFRKGLPEVSARNSLFAAVKNSEQHQKLFMGEAGAIHPLLTPHADDIVIVKHRISAFTGTDLDMILRANEIHTLVLFGIATSGVLLSTLCAAVDLDYGVIVIKDCCVDQDAELHGALINKYFTKRGEVNTADEFIARLASPST